MALVTEVTKRVDIPHEDGEWLQVRKLSWRQLSEADAAGSESSLQQIKMMGGEILKALREMEKREEGQPYSGYDKGSILRLGVVAWSYDAPCTPANIDLLDEATALFAFGEIMDLSKPRTEQDSKNA